jgi:two-component system sensor histidine kinase DesK
MDDVQRVARESLSAVRETIGGYRQPSLATELAGARSALAAAGIEGRVEPAPEGLPPAADAVLGWAVREGVTNILRHGRAGAAEILVRTAPSSAAVEIRNDRRGGDGPGTAVTAADDATAGAASGTGLAGLRERVAMIGGQVEAGGSRTAASASASRFPSDDPAARRRGPGAGSRGDRRLLGLERDLEVVADVARGDEVVPRALETTAGRRAARHRDARPRRAERRGASSGRRCRRAA